MNLFKTHKLIMKFITKIFGFCAFVIGCLMLLINGLMLFDSSSPVSVQLDTLGKIKMISVICASIIIGWLIIKPSKK